MDIQHHPLRDTEQLTTPSCIRCIDTTKGAATEVEACELGPTSVALRLFKHQVTTALELYHSNYLVWFETARILMLDEIGIPYLEIEARDLRLPALTATAEYKRPARFDDRLEIPLFMREKPRAHFRFEYEVRRGTTSHGFMDTNGRGLRPPEEFLAKINAAWQAPDAEPIEL